MDWKKELYGKDEKPLERLVESYSYTSVFRTMAFIGDSLSSGEFQLRDPEGKSRYHDMFEYSWGQYIARANGLLAYNFSRGGMTAAPIIERVLLLMVRMGGLEPPRDCSHKHLKLACLPIPPHPHIYIKQSLINLL